MAVRDPASQQFVSRYSDADLADVVRAVCRRVSPDVPTRVTTRAFDAEKTRSEWADAPNSAGKCGVASPVWRGVSC